jgi:hypothetical protein
MVSGPSFELVAIFSMTLSVQYFSYVQHIGNTTVYNPLFLSKKNIVLNLISFLMQICCQGQHLELLGY